MNFTKDVEQVKITFIRPQSKKHWSREGNCLILLLHKTRLVSQSFITPEAKEKSFVEGDDVFVGAADVFLAYPFETELRGR